MADKKAKTKQNLVIALVAYLFLLYMAVYFEGTSVLEVFILMSNRIASNPFAIGHAFDDLIFALQVIGALSAAYLVAHSISGRNQRAKSMRIPVLRKAALRLIRIIRGLTKNIR